MNSWEGVGEANMEKSIRQGGEGLWENTGREDRPVKLTS